MLRHLKNLKVEPITHIAALFFGRGTDIPRDQPTTIILRYGNTKLQLPRQMSVNELNTHLQTSQSVPVKMGEIRASDFWVYKLLWYSASTTLRPDEVKALIEAKESRARQTIERAKSLASAKANPAAAKRGQIPADLRQLVWAKFEGSCASCGATSELQFDHIIPVALGGGTSEENLQILCGPCNRSKGMSLS